MRLHRPGDYVAPIGRFVDCVGPSIASSAEGPIPLLLSFRVGFDQPYVTFVRRIYQPGVQRAIIVFRCISCDDIAVIPRLLDSYPLIKTRAAKSLVPFFGPV